MAGGAETLGLDEFGPDDDPWTATHLVSDFSLPALDDELERIKYQQKFAINDSGNTSRPSRVFHHS